MEHADSEVPSILWCTKRQQLWYNLIILNERNEEN